MIDEITQKKLIELYKSSKVVSLEGEGTGWVDLAAFGWKVNKAHIDYKGHDGKRKLTAFLRDSNLFDIITVRNKFIRLKNNFIEVKHPNTNWEVPEAIAETENLKLTSEKGNSSNKVKTIFEEDDDVFESSMCISPHDVSESVSLLDDEKKNLFEILKQSNTEDWNTFSKNKWVGIWKSVIEKYPETAHFIYELIQNADDAQSSEVAIVLYKDKLVFKHNGKRQFSITDENNHNGDIGDINSITAVANSTKKGEEQTIGKFGVGFKSVFQYTESPAIYDDTFWFRIDNYIIPTLLDSDHELRYEGETLFEIPFKNPEKAYREILDRLMNMRMPVLFLPHVKKITWKKDEEEKVHTYSKVIIQSNTRHSIDYDFCKVLDYDSKSWLYLFKRNISTSQGEYNISVGYFLNQDGTIDTKANSCVYCFFPTSERFEGCFVSHAPFLLTDNRDSIKTFEEINHEFLRGIAKLAADALLCLKDIGLNRNSRFLEDNNKQNCTNKSYIINDNIYKFINIHSQEERNVYLKECYLSVAKNSNLILSRSLHYSNARNTFVTTAELESLIKANQIQQLMQNSDTDFVFVQYYRSDLRSVATELGINNFDNNTLANKLTSNFMNCQSPEWIDRFLVYIRENARTLWVVKEGQVRKVSKAQYYWETNSDSWQELKLRFAPIVKAADGKWIAPYTLYNANCNVVLPFVGFENVDSKIFGISMDKNLYDKHKSFYEQLGIRKPSMTDYIKKVILPKYKSNNIVDDDIKKDFKIVYEVVSNRNSNSEIIKILKEEWKLKTISGDSVKLSTPTNLYQNSEEIKLFVSGSNSYTFFYSDFYVNENVDKSNVEKFVDRLFGLKKSPAIIKKSYGQYNLPVDAENYLLGIDLSRTYSPDYYDYEMDGYNCSAPTEAWSHLYWRLLCESKAPQANSDHAKAKLKFWKKGAQFSGSNIVEFDSTILKNLKNDKWIYYSEGTFCSPNEITLDEFIGLGYSNNSKWIPLLNFCENIEDSISHKDEKEKAEAIQKLKQQEEAERTELIQKATERGIDVNEILKKAISEVDESETYQPLITAENRNALHQILHHMSNDEINTLANKLQENSQTVIESITSDVDIPNNIANNIEPLVEITDAVGEENLPLVAEHVNEFMNWILDEDKAPSMVRRIIKYIGKKIYEQYLLSEDISYEELSNDLSDCDFSINDGEKYVKVISTLKSILDNKYPVGLTAGQNAFLRKHAESQIRVIRISLTDISVIYKYQRIIDVFGKEDEPIMNDRLKKECDDLAVNYWNGVTVDEFDAVSPEYSIQIERKN